GWDKTRHFPFLAFATKNRNRATARFRFFYAHMNGCFYTYIKASLRGKNPVHSPMFLLTML
ncbi:hypothetical protein, partial [Kurthia sp. Dielmo]|uniref:hypothetical protein n=1 Tax=Kurthia sp. Dielmo TaxID=1033738 RepID=UPI001C9630FE